MFQRISTKPENSTLLPRVSKESRKQLAPEVVLYEPHPARRASGTHSTTHLHMSTKLPLL